MLDTITKVYWLHRKISAIRGALLRGYRVYKFGKEIHVHAPYGVFSAGTSLRLISPLTEPLEEYYGFVDLHGAIVIDIGACIGETAMLFLSRGAKRVYAF